MELYLHAIFIKKYALMMADSFIKCFLHSSVSIHKNKGTRRREVKVKKRFIAVDYIKQILSPLITTSPLSNHLPYLSNNKQTCTSSQPQPEKIHLNSVTILIPLFKYPERRIDK